MQAKGGDEALFFADHWNHAVLVECTVDHLAARTCQGKHKVIGVVPHDRSVQADLPAAAAK